MKKNFYINDETDEYHFLEILMQQKKTIINLIIKESNYSLLRVVECHFETDKISRQPDLYSESLFYRAKPGRSVLQFCSCFYIEWLISARTEKSTQAMRGPLNLGWFYKHELIFDEKIRLNIHHNNSITRTNDLANGIYENVWN